MPKNSTKISDFLDEHLKIISIIAWVVAHHIGGLFYLIAQLIPNKIGLTLYGIFWIPIICFVSYILELASRLPEGNGDLSSGWVFIVGILTLSSTTAILGVFSRAIILYLENKIKKVRKEFIHLVSVFLTYPMKIVLILLGDKLVQFGLSVNLLSIPEVY